MDSFNPFKTAIRRRRISVPMEKLLTLNLLHGKILDYGTGYGKDVDYLRLLGYDINGYDGYNEEFFDTDLLCSHYDIVTCHYVFNVIPSYEAFRMEIDTLKRIANTAYISVRTDKNAIKKEWIYSETSKGYWTNSTFQRFYDKELIKKDFGSVQMIKFTSAFALFKLF